MGEMINNETKDHNNAHIQQLPGISEDKTKDYYQTDIFNKLLSLKQRISAIKIGNSGTLIFDEMPFYISGKEFKEAAKCNLYLKPKNKNKKLKNYKDRQKAITLRDRLIRKLKEELTYKAEDDDKPNIEKYHEIKYYIDECDKINAPIDYTVIYTILCARVDEINKRYLRKEDLLKDYLLDIYRVKAEADLSEGKGISNANMLKEAKNNKSHLSIIYDINELFKLRYGKNREEGDSFLTLPGSILSAEERLEINKLASFAQKHEIATTDGKYEETKLDWILRTMDILPEEVEIVYTPDCASSEKYLKSIRHAEFVKNEYERLKNEAIKFPENPLSYIRITTAPLRSKGDSLAREVYDLARSQARQEAKIVNKSEVNKSEVESR